MANKSLSPSGDNRQPSVSKNDTVDKLTVYRKTVGLDIFAAIFYDSTLRPQIIDSHVYMSMVSLVELVGDSKKKTDPRFTWANLKRRIQKAEPELLLNLQQLKMVAADGKERETDAAELQTFLKVLHRMKTKTALALSDLIDERVAGLVESAVNYRLMNIARGMEWAADTNHAKLKATGAFDDPELQQPDRWNDIIGGSNG